MSNKITLQDNNILITQNNIDLQALIDTANNLPEVGNGGDTSVETCTVTVANETPVSGEVYYQSSPGTYLAQTLLRGDTISFTAIQGSFVCAYVRYTTNSYTQGAEYIYGDLFLLTVGAGETATIQFLSGGTEPA